jgi:hypothetical protein
MRTEDHLRAALRLLEKEAPDAETMLGRVTERSSASTARRQSRSASGPGRRLVTGLVAAAAVVAVTVIALVLADLPGTRAPVSRYSALRSLPAYYMTFGPTRSSPVGKVYFMTRDLLIKSTLTARTLALISPPGRYVSFVSISGAADDRTFVLSVVEGAPAAPYGGVSSSWLEVARFDPADRKVTLTRLDIPIAHTTGHLTSIADVLMSPDGREIAVASNTAGFVQVKIYSLATGAVRTWDDTAPPVSYPLTGLGGGNLLTWASNGLLAFGWSYATSKGPMPVLPQGMRLLNTNLSGGSLIADSKPFCLPAENGGADYGQYLTSDGERVIVPVNAPVRIGQRPARCASEASTGLRDSRPAIEEFSVRTGRAIAILGQFSWQHPRTLLEQETLYWSNPDGSVLVVLGPAAHGDGRTLGVLCRGRFTPPPRAGQGLTTAIVF